MTRGPGGLRNRARAIREGTYTFYRTCNPRTLLAQQALTRETAKKREEYYTTTGRAPGYSRCWKFRNSKDGLFKSNANKVGVPGQRYDRGDSTGGIKRRCHTFSKI